MHDTAPIPHADEPTRTEIDEMPSPLMLEFGSLDCGHCKAAQALIAEALADLPATNTVRHLRIEDGKGRRLGRSFSVKLWPTLIFLRQGKEIARLVRPASTKDIMQALHLVTSD